MSKDKLLEIENLNAYYGETAAICGLSLSASRNESVGIIGESGSGKSTLLRAIAGIKTDGMRVEGRITFREHELTSMDMASRRQLLGSEISLVFQNPDSFLDPVMKVGRQMEEYLMFQNHLSRKEAAEKSEELLRHLSLPDPRRVMNSYPFELSGGMCQRVSIAMAAGNENLSLLLADEPTSALDQIIRRTTAELLLKVRADRQALLIVVTHDMRLIEQTADTVLVLYKGFAVEGGKLSEVLRAPTHPYTQNLLKAIPDLETDFRSYSMYRESTENLRAQRRVKLSETHWVLQ